MIKIFDFKTERLYGLDHLRALAIILVMIFHFNRGVPSWMEPIQTIGWSGVDLFFVLSGYLIGFQLLNEIKNTNHISFRRFYIKRFFRIIPAYIAVLIFYYSLSNLREGSGMPPLWKFLTFMQNLGLDALNQKSFSHAWSLCIEEQFYLLLPITIISVFYFRLQKGTLYIISALVILGFVLRIYNWNEHVQPLISNGDGGKMIFVFLEKIYYPSYNRMDGLLIGVSIAAIFSFRPKIRDYMTDHWYIVLLVGLGLFFLAYVKCENVFSHNTAIYGFPLISLAYGLIVIAAISPKCFLYKWPSKVTYIIATLSYAIYLTHKQIYHLTRIGLNSLGLNNLGSWTFWICIGIALIAGFILHLLVEKPFLRFRKMILSNEKV
jgi:peptidoglycan/LPS O-acetylase OafA/YrhL